MSIQVATWGDGNMVMVEDGKVISFSSEAALKDALAALEAGPVVLWAGKDRGIPTEPIADGTVRYAPGEPGFVKAALHRLPYATITGDD